MTNEEWYKDTQRRLSLVSRHFMPSEIQTVQNFIETAKDPSKSYVGGMNGSEEKKAKRVP